MWPTRHFSYDGPAPTGADAISRAAMHSDARRRPPSSVPPDLISGDDLGVRQRRQPTAATEIDGCGK